MTRDIEPITRTGKVSRWRKDGRARKRKSPFELLIDVELVVVIALVCAFIVPQLFGIVPEVVMSASMSPQVPAGRVAYIDENVGAGEMRVGDMAVYHPSESRQVLHRIAAIDGDSYTFKGDANAECDASPVDASQITGRYMFHVPEIGYAYSFFDENRVVVIVAIVVLNLLVYAVSERRRKGEEATLAAERDSMRDEVERIVSSLIQEPAAGGHAIGGANAGKEDADGKETT